MSEIDPLITLGALADPVRVEIVDRVAAGSEVTVTQLAAVMPMTRQGVARHVRTLEDASVLVGDRDGREVRFRVDPGTVAVANRWLVERGASWNRALDRLAEFIEST